MDFENRFCELNGDPRKELWNGDSPVRGRGRFGVLIHASKAAGEQPNHRTGSSGDLTLSLPRWLSRFWRPVEYVEEERSLRPPPFTRSRARDALLRRYDEPDCKNLAMPVEGEALIPRPP